MFKKGVYPGKNTPEILSKNRDGKIDLDMELIDQEDDKIKDLLLRMLDFDSGVRITVK